MIDAVVPVDLSVDDRRTLLLWLSKTVVTLDAAHENEECFPPEFGVLLYERRRLPRALLFMLACFSGSIEEGVTFAGRRVFGADNGLEADDDAVFGHLRIGRLLVEFFYPLKRPSCWHTTEIPHRRYFMPLPRKPVATIRGRGIPTIRAASRRKDSMTSSTRLRPSERASETHGLRAERRSRCFQPTVLVRHTLCRSTDTAAARFGMKQACWDRVSRECDIRSLAYDRFHAAGNRHCGSRFSSVCPPRVRHIDVQRAYAYLPRSTRIELRPLDARRSTTASLSTGLFSSSSG